MDTNIRRSIRASGGSNKVVVYTHDGCGRDGKPAIIYDPPTGMWSVETDRPLTPADFELFEKAFVAMKEQMEGVAAALASENPNKGLVGHIGTEVTREWPDIYLNLQRRPTGAFALFKTLLF